MVDDDEPKLPLEQAPAGRPANDQQPEAEPTEPPEGEQPEGEETETKPPVDDDDTGDADDEQDDDNDDDDDDEEEGDAKPRPKRIERYRREAERLKAENAALRNRTAGVPDDQAQLQRAFEYAVHQEIGDPPREEDYKGNYVAFHEARQAWEIDRRQVTRDVRKQFGAAIQQEQHRVAELVAAHKEREARFKKKVPDYDQVMAQAKMPVAPHVERLLIASKKSERLNYALGKNQAKLAQLNQMSSEEAAREIGRLEGRLSLPQPKTQTQARKPITPLKGSGASPPSATAARDAWLKKQYGDRA